MATQLENEPMDREHFQDKLPQFYRKILYDFQATSKSFVRFNLSFFVLFIVETCLFFASLLTDSLFMAIAIGALFVTTFTYLVLLFYYQAKKPEQMNALMNRFLASCRISLGMTQETHHLSVAEALLKLATYLTDYEWKLVKSPEVLSHFASRFSAYCYWYDVFCFKQILYYAAIDEHLQQIQSTPCDLEVHASLANTYVALSLLYKEPKGPHPRMKTYQKYKVLFEEKLKAAAALAVEEFKILSQYAPNDPWIHEQLALGYRELGLFQEEIAEVETLLKLRPHDKEIVFRLGSLYFEQGQNAKGLQIFEELKKANFHKVGHLISAYGRAEQRLTPIEI